MMGKDGQHVKESPTPSSRPHDDPHRPTTDSPPATSNPPDFPHQSLVPPQVAVIPPDQHQGGPLISPPWSHMTSHVTSGSPADTQHAMLFTSSRPGLVPPPPIPNIVVDPVPARDAFGHSRTPPFVPSPSEWGMRPGPGSRWSLTIPGLGKKPRAHSDSSIMGLDREQQTPTYVPPASATVVPTREAEGSVFRFEESYQPPRSRDSLEVPIMAARGSEASTRHIVETEVTAATIPMETDRPIISQGELGSSQALDLALSKPSTLSPPNLALVPESSARGAMDKPSVPFIWHFQSHRGFEKSPKTYWLRRHSDSNLPSEPQDLSTGGGPGGEVCAHPTVSSIRSHSTGDTVTRGRSEGDTPLPSPPPAHQPTRRRESPEQPTGTEGPGSREEEEVVSKRLKTLKLKKYLQKRYQLSLRRVRQLSDTDDVFSDRGPETPSPGILAASQGFTYHPATTGSSTSSRTESSSLEAEEPEHGTEERIPRHHEEEVAEAVGGSPARKPPLSLTETVPIKTEPISPCESEGEVEQPVFASPSFLPFRGHSESPRWQSNVFQFHAPGTHGHSSERETELSPEPLTPKRDSRSEHLGSPPEPRASVSSSGLGSDSSTPDASLAASPTSRHAFTLRPTSLEGSRTGECGGSSSSRSPSHLRSQMSPLSSTFPPAPEGGTPGPLPPFSTMLQRSPIPRPQVSAFSYTQPFASYAQGAPMSPAATAALGAPPWDPSIPPPSPGLSPSQQYPTPASLPSSQGPSGSKSEPSKIIYCPFSEKVQEQRHSRDPNTTFMCPVCGQVFPSYNYLANHMVNHLPSEVVTKGPGDSNKIHLCKVCNRAFSRSDMLTRHMRLHTGLRPYECRICGQVFSRSDHLHTHLRTHTGEKPYKCPQCPYAAPRRDMITRHMRIHMKTFSRRGRRSSSASSDLQPSQGGSDLGSQVQDVKRRNQSLSSVESQDSTESPYRRGSTTSEAPDIDSPQAKSRSWSVTSGESLDLPPSRHWSATSMESTESYPSPRGDHSPRARHYFSFHGSGDSGEGVLLPHGWGSAGDSIEEGMEQEASPSPGSTTQALSPASDSLSAEMQSSFQKCKVTSDKDSTSSSGSDKDTTMSPSGGSGARQQSADPRHTEHTDA